MALFHDPHDLPSLFGRHGSALDDLDSIAHMGNFLLVVHVTSGSFSNKLAVQRMTYLPSDLHHSGLCHLVAFYDSNRYSLRHCYYLNSQK